MFANGSFNNSKLPLVVGFENANGYNKSVSDRRELVYLNTVRERSDFEEDITGGVREGIYIINGSAYTVGDTNEYMTSSARGIERYSSMPYKLEALITIARHVDYDGEEVVAVTGVPSMHYKAPGVEEAIKKALMGSHTVSGKSFTVVDVEVMLQPLGTLNSLVYNKDLTLKDRGAEIRDARKLVIDIGWGTTDVAELEGKTLVRRDGVNSAMMDAYRFIESKLRKDYSRLYTSDFTLFELEQQLRNGIVFKYGGVPYEVELIKAQAFERTAASIMSGIASKGYTLDRYDFVIFTGGGVEALAKYLKDHLEGVNAIKVKNAQKANAEGYYIKGRGMVLQRARA